MDMYTSNGKKIVQIKRILDGYTDIEYIDLYHTHFVIFMEKESRCQGA